MRLNNGQRIWQYTDGKGLELRISMANNDAKAVEIKAGTVSHHAIEITKSCVRHPRPALTYLPDHIAHGDKEDLLHLGISMEWMVGAEHRQAYLQQRWPGHRSLRSDSGPSSSTQFDFVWTLLEGFLGRPYLNTPSWHNSMDLTIHQFKFNRIAMTVTLELRAPEAAVPWPSYTTKSQYASPLQELGAEMIDMQDKLRFGPMTKDGKQYKYEWSCLDPDLLARHGPDEFPFEWNINIPGIKCPETGKKYKSTSDTAQHKNSLGA